MGEGGRELLSEQSKMLGGERESQADKRLKCIIITIKVSTKRIQKL